jgi:hypothetical protein
MFDTAFEYLKDTACYLDLSSSMMFLGPKQTKRYISGYGAERILFGSDFPMWSPGKEWKAFMELKLPPLETEKIGYQNARNILGC